MRFFILLLIVTFLALCGVCLGLHYQVFLPQHDPDYHFSILMIANALLAVLSLTNYLIILDGLKNDNPNALIRAKTGGMMLKFFGSYRCIAGLYFYQSPDNGAQTYHLRIYGYVCGICYCRSYDLIQGSKKSMIARVCRTIRSHWPL